MLLHLVISSVLIANAMAGMTCPVTWFPYDSGTKCYIFLQDSVTFENAKAACTSRDANAKLMEIHDAETTAYLATQIIVSFWLGMTDPDGGGNFEFSNGDPVTYNAFGNTPAAGLECISQFGTTWAGANCSTGQHATACYLPTTASCEDPKWLLLPGTERCVRVFKGRRNKKTFDDAQAHCDALGGSLTTSIQKKSHIQAVMDTVRFRDHMWIGIHRDQNEVTSFVDQNEVTGYMPFKKNRGLSAKHKCATLKLGRWYGKRCSRKHLFVCEKDF